MMIVEHKEMLRLYLMCQKPQRSSTLSTPALPPSSFFEQSRCQSQLNFDDFESHPLSYFLVSISASTFVRFFNYKGAGTFVSNSFKVESFTAKLFSEAMVLKSPYSLFHHPCRLILQGV